VARHPQLCTNNPLLNSLKVTHNLLLPQFSNSSTTNQAMFNLRHYTTRHHHHLNSLYTSLNHKVVDMLDLV
jgi:hypothetical protein